MTILMEFHCLNKIFCRKKEEDSFISVTVSIMPEIKTIRVDTEKGSSCEQSDNTFGAS